MFYHALLASIIILTALFYYKFKIKPQKIKAYYVSQFKEKGFRVYEFPTKPFSYPAFMIINKDSKQGDAFKTFKQLYADYDVIVGNNLNTIEVTAVSPTIIKEFIKNQQEFCYEKYYLLVRNMRRVVGDGLTFSEKDFWKKKRKILSQVFSYDFIYQKHNEVIRICDETLRDAEIIAQKNGKYNNKKYIYDIMNFSANFTSGVITDCFLGGTSKNQTIDGIDVSHFLIALINDVSLQSTPFVILLGPKFVNMGLRQKDRDINRRIDLFQSWGISYIEKRIVQSKQALLKNPNKASQNIIEAILAYNIKNPEEYQFTSYDILQQFKNFMLAGTDTTSHYIQMIMGYLCQNPEAEKKLREQIYQIIKDNDYSYENLKKMKYLDAVQKQTTRMYGPVNFNFPRLATKDHYLGNVKIFQGTMVKFNMMGTHYNPQYYKLPYQFRPQRWLNGQCNNWDPYKLLGFGAGARTCIGKQLAFVETKIAIIKLLKRYQSIKLCSERIQIRWKFLYIPDNFQIEYKLAENQEISK